jgi:hypothetical protein
MFRGLFAVDPVPGLPPDSISDPELRNPALFAGSVYSIDSHFRGNFRRSCCVLMCPRILGSATKHCPCPVGPTSVPCPRLRLRPLPDWRERRSRMAFILDLEEYCKVEVPHQTTVAKQIANEAHLSMYEFDRSSTWYIGGYSMSR